MSTTALGTHTHAEDEKVAEHLHAPSPRSKRAWRSLSASLIASEPPKTPALHGVDGPRIKLSILMPAFNEERTLARAVADVLDTEYPCPIELIVVDDGSSDATEDILKGFSDPDLVVIRHPRNLGKGAALQTAAAVATGTHLVPFDADLEYAPTDLAALIEPVLTGRVDVVYGPRMFGVNTQFQSYRHAMGNRLLTFTANVLFDAYLSDMHTCLKVLPVDLFADLALSEDGFGLDTEITAKLLKRGVRPFEVPVSYYSRSVDQGKKITWRDGVECLQVLGRVRCSGSTDVATARHHIPKEAVNGGMAPLTQARRAARERRIAARERRAARLAS